MDADIEVGHHGNSCIAPSAINGGIGGSSVGTLSFLMKSLHKDAYRRDDHQKRPAQIEDYPSGYPRLSALIASHDSFHLCRRFSNLRARLLLLKQDRLSLLEKQLQKIDREEISLLSLGSSRRDSNSERNSILTQIDKALAEYDDLIERNHRILSFEAARPRAILNLQNWVNGNGCIAREETAYLDHSKELLGVASPDETVMIGLETMVEDCLARLCQCFNKNRRFNLSRDPNVRISPKSSTMRTARILMTPLIITLLLGPVIICNCLVDLTARLFIIITATTVFVGILSGSTKAKTIELVVAGATWVKPPPLRKYMPAADIALNTDTLRS